MGSRLPYPNRFYAAVGFAASPPVGAKAVSNDTRLLLYALYQQVTAGPCVDAKPWGWNAIETAKWQAWTTLKDMSKPDAMRHYVQTLEEENANWFQLVTDGEDPARVAEVTTAAQKAAEAMMDVTGRYTNVDADDNARAGEEIASTSERSRLNKAIDADADDSPTTTFAPTKPKSSPAPSPSKRAIPTANTSLGRFLGKISGAVANGAWSVVSERVSGDVPRGRYDHAAVVVGDELYAIGGTSGGRRAGDVHALHVPTLTWRKAAVRGTGTAAGEDEPSPSFGRRSGHAAVVVGAKIVVVGGFEGRDPREADDATCDVWILDTASAAPWRWRTLALRGGDDAPRARGGHTATVVARRGAATSIVVFGGEDLRGRLLGDVHVLRIDDDVEKGGAEKGGGAFTGSWSTPGAVFAPASFTPRSHHVAAYFHGEVFVFGGVAKGGAGRETDALFALDVDLMAWREVTPRGDPPSARIGAAAVVTDGWWFIAGGGGAGGAAADTAALRVSRSDGVFEWVRTGNLKPGHAVASEGLTVSSAHDGAALIAFGGYDGERYGADVSVLWKPTESETVAARAAEIEAAATKAAAAEEDEDEEEESGERARLFTNDVVAASSNPMGGIFDPIALAAARSPRARSPRASAGAAEATSKSSPAPATPRSPRGVTARGGGDAGGGDDDDDVASLRARLAMSERDAAATKLALSDEQAKTLRLELEVAQLRKKIGEYEEAEAAAATRSARARAAREAEDELAGGGGGGGGGKRRGLWGFIAGDAPEYEENA